MSQLSREKETVQERLVQITRERDTALRVSENRRRAWEMHQIQSLEQENYLQDQIEAGHVEIHRLNNLLHPIPHPAPVYLEVGPQVIVADDDGMQVDGPAAAAQPLHEDVEDEELEQVSDEVGEAIFDADSDDCWVFLISLPKVDNFLILVTVKKIPNLSLTPLKPSCHPQHDMRDAVLKYAIALLNK